MDSDEMMRDTKDAEQMFHMYKKRGGKAEFTAFLNILKLFFLHTLNSHVFGLTSDDYEGQKTDGNGYCLHESPEMAESTLMDAAKIDMDEFARIERVVHAHAGDRRARDFAHAAIFRSVDDVHPYT